MKSSSPNNHLRPVVILLIIVLFILVFGQIGCVTPKKDKPEVCRFKSIERLISYQSSDGFYTHFLLLKDFSRNCADSTEIMTIVNNYIDTVSIDKPIEMICLYNSDTYWYKGDYSQDFDVVDRNCIVKIIFNKQTLKPNGFAFYNEQEVADVYQGVQWINKGFGDTSELKKNKRQSIVNMLKKGADLLFIANYLQLSYTYIESVRREENIPRVGPPGS